MSSSPPPPAPDAPPGSPGTIVPESWAEPGAGPLPLPGSVRPDGTIVTEADVVQAQIDRTAVAAQGHSVEELERLRQMEALPPLSDEELARQAQAAPGGDGDPTTPE